MQKTGLLKFVDGQIKMDADGAAKAVSVGDTIPEGAVLLIADNTRFEMVLNDGSLLVGADAESQGVMTLIEEEAVDPNTLSEIKTLQEQIRAGDDPTEDLPDTAAGNAPANQGDSGYVSLARTGSETLAAAGFDTTGEAPGAVAAVVEPQLPGDYATAALNDEVTVEEGAVASGNVLSNDVDIDSSLSVATFEVEGSTYTAGTSVVLAGGVLIINADGSFTFTPNEDWNGTVPVITYTTNTGATATLTINVTPVDDPTTAVNDVVTVAEDTVATGNVLDNDSDIDSELSVVSFEVEGNNYGAGSSVELTGGVLIINADGSYSFTPNADWNGTVPVITYTTNTGATATLTINITPVEDGAPIVVINTDANNDGFISNEELGGATTVNVTIDITPTGAIAGDTLTVNGVDIVLTQEDIDNGFVNMDLPSPGEGETITVVATVTDQAGNESPQGSDAALLDTTPPVITVDAPDNSNDTTPTITGTTDAEPGSTVTIIITDSEGGTQTLTTTVNEDGTYAVDVTDPLPEGGYTADASVTDPAGNTATDSDDGSVDITPPVITVDAPDNTNDTTPVITGTTDATPGSTVTIIITDSEGGTQTLTTTVNEDGTYEVEVTDPLPGGNYTADASVTDAAGNTATDTDDGSVDATAPTIIVEAPDNTTDDTPTITGTTDADPGSTVTIVITDSEGGTQTLTTTVNEDGTYSVDVAEPLPEGGYTADASVTDTAGNTGTDSDDGDVVYPEVIISANQTDVSEGDSASFTVSLDQAATEDVTVSFSYSGTAADGSDFTGVVSVVIPAGQTSVTVDIATIDDTIYEGSEDFTISISGVSGGNATIGANSSASTNIVDDGTGPGPNPNDDRPTLSVTDAGEVSEGSDAIFTVGLSNPTEAPLTINLGLNLGSAEATDLGTMTVTYVDGNGQTQTLTVAANGDVTVPAGVTSLTVTVATTQDSVYEGDETFSLQVTESGGITTNGATGVSGDATIVDDGSVTPPGGGTADDDRPTLSVTDAGEVSEGSDAVFTVGLSNPTEAPLTINLGLNLGSAEATDLGTMTVTYVDGNGQTQTLAVDSSGNVTIPAGVTSLTVTVATTQDSVYEGDETFSLQVTESGGITTNGTAGVTGDATIVDDGSVTPPGGGMADDDRPTLSVTDAGEVSEGSDAIFTVGLSNPTEAPLTINLGLNLGSAEASDLGTMTVTYVDGNGQTQTLTVAANGDVTVPAGVTSLTVTVATTQDSVYEGDETFSLQVTETGGITTNGATGVSGDATIVDDGSVTPPGGGTADDDRPTLSVTDAGEVSEGSDAVFTVGLSNPTEAPLTINLGLNLGTAEATDIGTMSVTYVDGNGQTQTLTVAANGDVTVPAGVTSLTVTVATTQDSVYEGDETFSLQVTEAGGITTNGATGVTGDATIVDDGSVTPPGGGTADDDRPTLSVTDAGEVSEGSDAVFTVGLSNPTEAPLTINLGLNLGSAEASDLGTMTVTYVDGNGQTQTLAVDSSGNVTIPAGVTSLTVTVATTQDSVYEGDETFSLQVTEAGGITTNGATGVSGDATIVDDGSVTPPGGGMADDDRPTLSVADAGEVSEGSDAIFTVGLSNPTEAPLTINLGLNLGSAEATDLGTMTVTYVDGNGQTQTLAVDGSGNVTIPAGVTSLTVTVATTQDSVYEGDETFSLQVTEAGGITTNGATGVSGDATIVDDGSVTPPGGGMADDDRPTLSVADAGEVSEGSDAIFTVGLSNPTEAPLTINLGLNLGSAEASDLGSMSVTYVDGNGQTQTLTVAANGDVTVPAGVTSLTVTVATTQDSVYEGDETFSLQVTESGGITTNGATGVSGDATIVDDGSVTPPGGGTADDDRPTLSVTDAGEVSEGSDAVFTVGLSNPTEAPLTINLGLNLGTAEASDIGSMSVTYVDGNGQTQTLAVDGSGNVTIPAGVTSLTVTVATIQDSVYEGDETFSLQVTEAGGITTNGATGVSGDATIVDDGSVTPPGGGTADDDRPTLSVTDAGEVSEGSDAVFTVGLSNPTEAPLTINLGLNLGTAEATDLGTMTVTYVDGNGQTQTLAVDGSGNVTIPAGVTSLTVTVATTQDSVYEGDETFSLQVTEAGGITTNGATGVSGDATIVDDGSVTPPGGGTADDDRPTLSVTDAGEVSEGSDAVFTVGLSNPTEAPLTINLGLNLGSAEATDIGTMSVSYVDGNGQIQTLAVDGSGNVTIPAGVTSLTVTVATTQDSVYEGDETFSLQVTEAGGITTNGATGVSGDATIVDSLAQPGVSISDAGTINEGDIAAFTVTLNAVSEADTEVKLTLNAGDTDAADMGNLEYFDGSTWQAVPADGIVTIPAGSTSLQLRVQTTDDSVYEGAENFSVTVTGQTGVTGTDTGTATIVDDGSGPGPNPDDDRPSVTISDAGSVNEGSIASFTVSLSAAAATDTEVKLTLNAGDTDAADMGNLEYFDGTTWLAVPADGIVTIAAGSTSLQLRVQTTDDSVYEGAENFSVTVTGQTGVTGTDTGTATIVDDGSGPGPNPDDDRPSVTISDAGSVNEGSIASFTVSLSAAAATDTEVKLTLNAGDTDAADMGNLEYFDGTTWLAVPADGIVTIPAGSTSLQLRVQTTDDSVYEGAENFSVTVTGQTGVTGTDTGTATIVDDGSGPGPNPDDDRPSVTISDAGSVNEGSIASFTVSLSAAAATDTEVKLTLNAGDTDAADMGNLEYFDGTTWLAVPADGIVTIAAGSTSLQLRVQTTDDSVYEGAENFSVTVTGQTGVTGTDTGTATIVDDGSGPGPNPDDDRPSVTISDAGSVNEGSIASFTVSLSAAAATDTEVKLTLNAGDTDAADMGNLEYFDGTTWQAVPANGIVTIPAGSTSLQLRVQTTDDSVYEGAENFSVTVTGQTGVTGTDTGTATIVDDGSGPGPNPDDDRPSVTISDAGSVNEGSIASFTVSLSAAAATDTEVKLTLNAGDTDAADMGNLEYFDGTTWLAVPADGIVTIAAGSTSLQLRVQTTDDSVYEGAENFSVTVTGQTGVTGTDTGTATIVDDGSGPGPNPDDDRPSVTISDAGSVNEGSIASFTVSLSAAAATDTEVKLTLNAGDTDAADMGNLEYFDGTNWLAVPADGIVTIPAGSTSLQLRVQTTDDSVYEGAENFSVTVTGQTGVTGTDTGTATIVDDGSGPGPNPDDDRPSVTISDAGSVNEGSIASFTVSLSAAAATDTEVKLTLNAGDTDAADMGNLEYFDGTTWLAVPADGIVTIPAGSTSLQLRVQTTDDSVYEGAENFSVTVTGQTGVTGTDTGTATIVDDGSGPGPNPDDDRPSVTISDAGSVNEGSIASFTVSLSAAAATDTEVKLTLNAGDTDAADMGNLEYFDGTTWLAVPADGIVTIAAGSTSLQLRVQTTDDSVYEGAENFSVTVTGQTGVTGTDTGTATIVDDGSGPGPNPDDDRPSVTISDAGSVNEGSIASFTVSLSAAAATDTEVKLTLNAGDTDAADMGNLEYFDGTTWQAVPANGIVTIPAGSTSLQLRVQTTDDSVYEGAENFSVTVTGQTGVTGTDTGTATIVDDGSGPGPNPDDDRPSVTISDAGSVNEGSIASFTVSLSAAAATDTEVKLTLNAGDTDAADMGNLEYFDGTTWLAVPADGIVTIAAGSTSLQLRVQTTDDSVYEGAENFSVTVTGQTGVTGTDTGTATIVDDGSGPGPNPDDDRPSVTISDAGSVNEGSIASFTVSLSAAAATDTEVKLTLNAGDTDAADMGNLEYFDGTNWLAVPADGIVTIPAGSTSLQLRVQTTDDSVYEGAENFSVTVTGQTGVTGTDTGTATIVDDGSGPGPNPDDDRPSVTISDAGSVNEGSIASFTVSLSAAAATDTEVKLTLNAGDTDAADMGNLEYFDGTTWLAVPADGIVTIAAGSTSLQLRVQTTDDSVYEGAENFSVTVTGQTGVTGTDTGTATIVDDGSGPGPNPDDDRPSVTISDAGSVNEGSIASFTVSLSAAAATDTEVKLTLNAGDTDAADMGNLEYFDGTTWLAVPADGIVTIPAGSTSLQLRVQTTDDSVYEGAENFSVTVTGQTGVTGTDTGSATIVDTADLPVVNSVVGNTVVEGQSNTFVVTLSNASTTATSVTLALSSDSATVGTDTGTTYMVSFDNGATYTAVIGSTVTVPAGASSFLVQVATLDDTIFEGSEQYRLSATANGTGASGIATITDNDSAPVVGSIVGNTVVEGDVNTFTVTTGNTSTTDTVLNLTLANGTAVKGADYTGNQVTVVINGVSQTVSVAANGSFSVTLPAGQNSFQVLVQTKQDSAAEPTETYTLSSGSVTGTATIIDNDIHGGGSVNLALQDADTKGSNQDTATQSLSFTASGAADVTGFSFGSTAGITVSGLNGNFVWTQDAATGNLIGSIGGVQMVILSLSGSGIGAGETGSVSVTATLLDDLQHQSSPNADEVVVSGIQVVATDSLGSTATGTVAITVTDDNNQANDDNGSVSIIQDSFLVSGIVADWKVPTGGSNIDRFDGTSNPNGGGLDNDSGLDQLRWGNPTSTYKSGYGFIDNDAALSGSLGLNEDIVLGTFTHYNWPTAAGTAITAASMDVTFSVTDSYGVVTPVTLTVDFAHDETTNNPNDPEASKDIVTVSQTSVTFNYEGAFYTLQVIGFRDPVTGQVVTEIRTAENAASSYELVVRVVAGDGYELPSTSGNVLTNDVIGADDTITLIGVQAGDHKADGVSGNVGTQIVGQYGVLTLYSDGSYDYQVTVNNSDIPQGAVDTFTYTVLDGDGDESSALLNIDLNKVDFQQVKANLDTKTGLEDGGPIEGNVLDNDGDNNTDVVSFKVAGDSSEYAPGARLQLAEGELTLNADGSYIFKPAADWNGTVPSVTYTTNTGASAALIIQVTPVDDASVLAPDSKTINEDQTATGNVLTNDTDVDNTLSVTSFQVAGSNTVYTAGSTAHVLADGVLTLNSNGNYSFVPNNNWNGTVPEITYTTNTGSTSTLNITVNAVADAPVLTVGNYTSVAAINFEDVSFNGPWDGVVANEISGLNTIGTWYTSNANGQIEVGYEKTYLGGTSTNKVMEIEFHNGDKTLYTDMSLEAGRFYELGFDIAARNTTSSGLTVKLVPLDANGQPLLAEAITLYDYNPTSTAWLLDQKVTLPVNATGNYRLLFEADNADSVGAILDNLSFSAVDNYGYKDDFIKLGNIGSSLVDADNSESLSVQLQGLPVGAVLKDANGNQVTVDANGSVDITDWDKSSLQIKVTTQGNYTATVVATSVESSNQDTAQSSVDFQITVLGANPVMGDIGLKSLQLNQMQDNSLLAARSLMSESSTEPLQGSEPAHADAEKAAQLAFGAPEVADTPEASTVQQSTASGEFTVAKEVADALDDSQPLAPDNAMLVNSSAPQDAAQNGDPGQASNGDSGLVDGSLLIQDGSTIVGLGDEVFHGTDGADTFVWKAGDTGTDHIIDFDLANDKLDLSDLLQNEEHHSLEDYLSFDIVDGSTTIAIDANLDGKVDQRIVLDGVDLAEQYGLDVNDESGIINGLIGNGDGPLIVDTDAGDFQPVGRMLSLEDENKGDILP
ncbi:immunoglobulin-like domain-containing protein [Shewanella khirikhana]|nr:immunoglobulin-like domain-containing protein [Shewanella khirikhana]